MEQVIDKLLAGLAPLATKFGMTVQELWTEVINYTALQGIIDISVSVFVMLGALGWLISQRKKKFVEDNVGHEVCTQKVFALVLLVFSGFVTIMVISTTLATVINPVGAESKIVLHSLLENL